MYASPHFAGDAISRYAVFGTLQDSTEVPIIPEDLGIGYWHFRKRFINGLARDNYDEVKAFVHLYQNTRQRRLVSVRLENHPLILAKDGVRSAPPQILKNFSLELSGKKE